MLNLAYFVKMKLDMLKISYYGHSCFKFSSENVSLVIDPYQGVPNLEMPFVSSTSKCGSAFELKTRKSLTALS